MKPISSATSGKRYYRNSWGCRAQRTAAGLLPGPAGHIQHLPHAVLLQQGNHPALVFLGPALDISDVQLPHFGCLPVGVLIRKSLGRHAERAGPEDTVDRHAARLFPAASVVP